MSDVFISYSRVDKVFVRRLHDALATQNRDVWIDWEDIEYAEDWWQKICAGIEEANNFVFIITPDSARSKVCFDEIDHATKNNKRIVPMLHVDVTENPDKQRMHPAISSHNWLPFHDTDDFDASFSNLLKTVDKEPAHVNSHTRLLMRAQEWSNGGHPSSLLIRGNDLRAAEAWLAAGVNKEPRPTDLHAEYIAASRKAETGRQRLLLAGVSISLIIAVVLSAISLLLYRRAENNAATAVYEEGRAKSIALVAQAQLDLNSGQPDRAVLLGLMALEKYPYTWQAEQVLATAVQSTWPRLLVPVNGVTYVVWSPDGTRILVGDSQIDGTARILDAASGVELHAFPSDGVMSADWSPDGTRIASVSIYYTMTVRDTVSGMELPTFSPIDSVLSADWSPDGTRIVTASFDKTAIVWDAASGEKLLTLASHTDAVMSAAWSPDGTRIFTASLDKTAIVWDAASGEKLLVLRLQNNPVVDYGADWSPDGTRLITVTTDSGRIATNAMTMWDAVSGVKLVTHVGGVAWSSDGADLLIYNMDNTVTAWNIESDKELFTLTDSKGLYYTTWSPDGTQILSIVLGVAVKVWDATHQPELLTLSTDSKITNAVWSPDGTRILTAMADNTAIVWDATSGKKLFTPSGCCGLWSPDGTRILTVNKVITDDPGAKVWDASSGKELLTVVGHTDGVMSSAAWSPDGTRILTLSVIIKNKAIAGGDGATVWDTSSGKELLNFGDHADFMSSAIWSPDSKYILTTSQIIENGTLGTKVGDTQLWDASNGRELWNFGSETYITEGGWSPNGTLILIKDSAGIKVWDAEKNVALFTLSGCCEFWSQDGTRILTFDGPITHVWDARTGMELLTLSNIDKALLADGTRILTADNDHVSFRDVATGGELFTLSGCCAEWSPDGKHIITVTSDGTAKIWRRWQTTADLIAYARECCVVRQLTDDERRQFNLQS